jgi:hypothetical protein
MNAEHFIQSALQQFREYKSLSDKTFLQLSDDDFYFQPNEETNSIAINITHMHGNMQSRFSSFLTEDGEKPWRHRDDEFRVKLYTRVQLLDLWEAGWQTVFTAIEQLFPADIEKTVYIRTKPLSVLQAIHRQLTHYAYHTGQIVMLGKIVRNKDWQSLSIPRDQSQQFNERLKKH